jgi:hypothetical protein
MSQLRKDFVDLLDKLQESPISKDEWFHWMVNHYPDAEMETVRREIVRLSIEGILYTETGKIKIAEWQETLLK